MPFGVWLFSSSAATMRGSARAEPLRVWPRQAGAQSYSSQWRCDTLEQLGNLRSTSARLCQDVLETHGEACLAFSTLMRGLNLAD